MTHEDEPIGRLLSRREVMAFLGATGAVWLAGGSLFPRWAIADTLGPSARFGPHDKAVVPTADRNLASPCTTTAVLVGRCPLGPDSGPPPCSPLDPLFSVVLLPLCYLDALATTARVAGSGVEKHAAILEDGGDLDLAAELGDDRSQHLQGQADLARLDL